MSSKKKVVMSATQPPNQDETNCDVTMTQLAPENVATSSEIHSSHTSLPGAEAIYTIQQDAKDTDQSSMSTLSDRYPASLTAEYRILIAKKYRRTLTAEEAVRLQAIRDEINAIDRTRSQPDTWDIQHRKLQLELAQIRAEAEALLR